MNIRSSLCEKNHCAVLLCTRELGCSEWTPQLSRMPISQCGLLIFTVTLHQPLAHLPIYHHCHIYMLIVSTPFCHRSCTDFIYRPHCNCILVSGSILKAQSIALGSSEFLKFKQLFDRLNAIKCLPYALCLTHCVGIYARFRRT